jgi:hypothetical protein
MPLIEIDPAAPPPPTPAPAAQQPAFVTPPVGTHVNIVSAVDNRAFHADGKVVGTDGSGIAVRLPEAGVARFYPWQQVAYVQWTPPAEVMEQAAELGGDFAVTEESQAAIIAVLAKIPGITYPSEAADKIRAWDGYIIEGDPQGTFTSDEFVRELAKAGIPVRRYVARPAHKRPIIVGEAAWGGGEDGFGVDITGGGDGGADFGAGSLDTADYRQPDEREPDQVGEMVMSPAQHAYRLPPSLASCYPDHEVAIWAAASHAPEELEAIHKITDARDFGEYMRRIRDHVPGPMPGTPAYEAYKKHFGHAPDEQHYGAVPDTLEPHAPGTCGVPGPGVVIPEMAHVRCSLPIHTGDHQATFPGVGPFHWRGTGIQADMPVDGPSDNWRPQPAPPCAAKLGPTQYPAFANTGCRLAPHADGVYVSAHETVDEEGAVVHWYGDGPPVLGPAPDAAPLAWANPPTPPEPPAPPTEDPQELPPEPGEVFPDPGFGGGPTDEAEVAQELAAMEAAFKANISGPLDAGAKAIAKAEELLAQHKQPAEPEAEKPEDKPWTLPGQE